MRNKVAEFFSSIAPKWDEMEVTPPSFIDALLARCEIKQGARVLDLACGTGIITGRLATLTGRKVIGMDIAPKMIEIARSKYEDNPLVDFVAADFCQSDFHNDFDNIIIYNAYPHFLDRQAFLDALLKALKENGEFAIIHSLSREALAKHHERLENISRALLPVEEESSFYASCFDILQADESDSHYFIRAKRK